MNIKVFRTNLGEDIVADVLEVQHDHYLLMYALTVIENPMENGNFLARWARYSSPHEPIKLFKVAVAAEIPPSPMCVRQYTQLIKSYLEYVKNNPDDVSGDVNIEETEEGVTISTDDDSPEAKDRLYKNVLQFIRKPADGKMN